MTASFFDYYYGLESEQYNFFRIPKLLFIDKRFQHISSDAKILYGIMLDRMNLSRRNKWIDKENRVYIIFSVNEIMETLNCAEQKAVKLLAELDSKKGIGLIEKKRQGQGKPSLIYVKNFIVEKEKLKQEDSENKNCDNHNSRTLKVTSPKLRKSQSNNINKNKTDKDNSLSELKRQIMYDELVNEREKEKREIDLMIDVMNEIRHSTADSIRINKKAVSVEKVKEVYEKIEKKEAEYVLDNLCSAGNIIYPRRFIITALFNARSELQGSMRNEKMKSNLFNTFTQRNYDFDALERELLKESRKSRTN